MPMAAAARRLSGTANSGPPSRWARSAGWALGMAVAVGRKGSSVGTCMEYSDVGVACSTYGGWNGVGGWRCIRRRCHQYERRGRLRRAGHWQAQPAAGGSEREQSKGQGGRFACSSSGAVLGLWVGGRSEPLWIWCRALVAAGRHGFVAAGSVGVGKVGMIVNSVAAGLRERYPQALADKDQGVGPAVGSLQGVHADAVHRGDPEQRVTWLHHVGPHPSVWRARRPT